MASSTSAHNKKTPSIIYMWHPALYTCDTQLYIHVTPSFIYMWHPAVYTCDAQLYIHVTPSFIYMWHPALYTCDTQLYIHVTPSFIYMWHPALYTCDTQLYIHVTPSFAKSTTFAYACRIVSKWRGGGLSYKRGTLGGLCIFFKSFAVCVMPCLTEIEWHNNNCWCQILAFLSRNRKFWRAS